MTDVVEAAAFNDDRGAAPRSVTTYRFAEPMAVTIGPAGAIDPQVNRAMKSIAYLDEFGRTVQARERLGFGTAQDLPAGITQGLTGWRVTTSVVFDGAGRPRVVWAPYLVDAGEAFTDPVARPPVTDVRATATQYDDQGRPTCVSVEYMRGDANSAASGCTSNSGPTANDYFRLATGTSYRAENVGYGPFGGWLVVTETVAPDQNMAGRSGSTRTYSSPGGAVYGATDAEGRSAWILRDPLGREIGSWRQSSTGSTPNPASSIVYDPDRGVVLSRWDANAPAVTQQFLYDDQGRVTRQTTGAAGEYVKYEYKSFGRVTSVQEYGSDGFLARRTTTTSSATQATILVRSFRSSDRRRQRSARWRARPRRLSGARGSPGSSRRPLKLEARASSSREE